MIQLERIKDLNDRPVKNGKFVVYWMQASARAECNHALEYATARANELSLPLLVFFGLTGDFPEANARHFVFMLEGLRETEKALEKRGISLIVRIAPPDRGIVEFAREAACVVTDRGYLKIQKKWRAYAAQKLQCRLTQVESDIIVPVETASDKAEFAARTLRPKILRNLDRFLVELPASRVMKHSLNLTFESENLADIPAPIKKIGADGSVKAAPFIKGGTSIAKKLLDRFIDGASAKTTGIECYGDLRNDPTASNDSGLSPYLHFGQISPLHAALEVKRRAPHAAGLAAFLEQLIVRRELSLNFCEYDDSYDGPGCLPDWAIRTLEKHEGDKHEYVYSKEELEAAATRDHYWNAAQLEMVATGKMHGYMRMYWGKKIIEWTRGYERAYEIALYLNNRYELDGRDPNGFAGVAWCFGKHDRPWFERPVFGTVRYMNDSGLKRKFAIDAYVAGIAKTCRELDIKLPELTHLMAAPKGTMAAAPSGKTMAAAPSRKTMAAPNNSKKPKKAVSKKDSI